MSNPVSFTLLRRNAFVIAACLSCTLATQVLDAQQLQGTVHKPWIDLSNVIIETRPGDDIDRVLKDTGGGKVWDQLGSRPIYLVSLTPKAVSKLSSGDRVIFAELNRVARSPENDPANPIWNSVSAIESTRGAPALARPWAEEALGLKDLPAQTSAGNHVVVGLLDTGVDSSHRELQGHVVADLGYDFIDDDRDTSEVLPSDPNNSAYGHGTHVAGIIATAAPFARILPIRVLDSSGVGTVWTVAKGVVWALERHAVVLNLSLGTHEQSKALRRVMQIAVCDPTTLMTPGFKVDRDRCQKFGPATVFAGAGNDRSSSNPLYPAAFLGIDGVVSVTATAQKGSLASFANWDKGVDIAAPGDRITSTFPGNKFATKSGTSMATPWVAGTAARLLTIQPRGLAQPSKFLQAQTILCKTPLPSVGQIDPMKAVMGRSRTSPTSRVC